MADGNHGAGSAIAKEGVMTQGSLAMAGAQASLKPMAQTLASPLEAPGSTANLALALADASLQIKHLADGQVRLVDTLELFNVSLLKVMDARQAEAAGNAEGTKITAAADKRTPSQALDAAMTDLDQLLRFTRNERKALREANLAMASEPVVAASGASAVDLAKVEYAAARTGIGSDRKDASGNIDPVGRQADLQQFTRDAAIMATAFKIDVKNAGELMGGWRESMQLDRAQALDLADATNVLGTQVSLKAESADIGAIVQHQGAAAKAAGMSPEQAAALSAALLSAGNSKAVAGAGLEKISAVLAKGDNASAGQRSAWAELKLDPKVLAAGMKQDAPQAVLTVLEALKSQSAERQAVLATQLFDGNQTILSLVPVIGSVKQAFSLVAEKSTYATSTLGDQGSVLRSAAVRADSTYARRQAYEASTTRLSTASDTALAPVVDTSLTAMNGLVSGVAWLAEGLPKAAAAVTLAGAVLIPVISGVFGAVKDKIFEKVAGKVLGEGPAAGNKTTPPDSQRKAPSNDGHNANLPSASGPGISGNAAKVSTLAKGASLSLVVAQAGIEMTQGAMTGNLGQAVGTSVGSIGGGVAGGVVGDVAGMAIGRAVGTLAGAVIGSVVPGAGTVLGGVMGGVAGGAIGKVVGGAVGTFVGSDVGAWLAEKVMGTGDRLPSPTEVSKNLNAPQADNRQINFAPQITITAPEQASHQQLAALVVQQIEAQFTPLSMDNLLATRRGAALTDGAV
ncbi:phage tail tape measure protein [Pseudomonas fluorescens]|uniref:phage tail tape measure protein n=1 Tax=Pseudomonas fluorescens TaxID=294 RepID=UPI00177DA6A7|nr:phage tail tape measure protein [Pseudomonas fluorescens]MBD8192100.1 phage tail tape measure protein [Pseudomonas fluorescens]MBD8226724.1 phage tail tape measure protein [Pseudomonas fluorescens]MBD8784437.1 phage tail tape measure protein [Pseudomonas fluorescens]MBD8817117.1 phage tail tape measure protein [Pseudomonas fluorescens]